MSVEDIDLDVEGLSEAELAAALEAYDGRCDYRAAVGLIIEQGSWLRRWEFRQAVEAWVNRDGQPMAWVDWEKVDTDAAASSGELRILHLARSLAGIASERSLSDLLTSLDENNFARVWRAIGTASGWARWVP